MEQQQKELRIGGKIDSKRLTDLEGGSMRWQKTINIKKQS